jgi:hypothetical protein
MKTERKITEAEKKRMERFLEKAESLKTEGYEESGHRKKLFRPG